MTRPFCRECGAAVPRRHQGDECPDCGGGVERPPPRPPRGLPLAVALPALLLVLLAGGALALTVGLSRNPSRHVPVAAVAFGLTAVGAVGLLARREWGRQLTGVMAVVWTLAGGLVVLCGMALVPAFGAGCFVLPFGVTGMSAGTTAYGLIHSPDARKWCRRPARRDPDGSSD